MAMVCGRRVCLPVRGGRTPLVANPLGRAGVDVFSDGGNDVGGAGLQCAPRRLAGVRGHSAPGGTTGFHSGTEGGDRVNLLLKFIEWMAASRGPMRGAA